MVCRFDFRRVHHQHCSYATLVSLILEIKHLRRRSVIAKVLGKLGLVAALLIVLPVNSATANTAAPVFTLDATVESVNQCASVVGYRVQSTGGTISSFTISPTPIKGLLFNSTTGQLSGKPEVVSLATQYSITGSNSAGSSTQFFTLTVTQPQAYGIYPTCQVVSGTVGVPLTPTVKYYDMWVTTEYNFTVSPALPAGLSIHPLTGIISGTPTEATPGMNVDYTVRMDEEDGPNQWFATVTLTVAPKAPDTTTTTTTVQPTKRTTIVCVKGSVVRRVTAVSPKCPKGFKKRTR